MILVLKEELNDDQKTQLEKHLEDFSFFTYLKFDDRYLAIAPDKNIKTKIDFLRLPFVKEVIETDHPYPLASHTLKKEASVVQVGDLQIGGPKLTVMAGPCSIETQAQLEAVAKTIMKTKTDVFRAGAFKPRSSPYTFQGLGKDGLTLLKNIKQKYKIPIISEIIAPEQIEEFDDIIDILQIGARNMQNYHLLKALAKSGKPVLLKRNPANTIDEWLMSAEYLLAGGNENVILCERGSKTFDPKLPIAFNTNIIKTIKENTHLPLIVDPSHATGDSSLVEQIALSAVIAGADGVLIEVHPRPELAVTDARQVLSCESFVSLTDKLQIVSELSGRRFR